jgi:hypothetical protein
MKPQAFQPLRENNRDNFDDDACDHETSQDDDRSPPSDEAEEPNDFDDPDDVDLDDVHWDAFLADDDELDPQPDPGDFYLGD